MREVAGRCWTGWLSAATVGWGLVALAISVIATGIHWALFDGTPDPGIPDPTHFSGMLAGFVVGVRSRRLVGLLLGPVVGLAAGWLDGLTIWWLASIEGVSLGWASCVPAWSVTLAYLATLLHPVTGRSIAWVAVVGAVDVVGRALVMGPGHEPISTAARQCGLDATRVLDVAYHVPVCVALVTIGGWARAPAGGDRWPSRSRVQLGWWLAGAVVVVLALGREAYLRWELHAETGFAEAHEEIRASVKHRALTRVFGSSLRSNQLLPSRLPPEIIVSRANRTLARASVEVMEEDKDYVTGRRIHRFVLAGSSPERRFGYTLCEEEVLPGHGAPIWFPETSDRTWIPTPVASESIPMLILVHPRGSDCEFVLAVPLIVELGSCADWLGLSETTSFRPRFGFRLRSLWRLDRARMALATRLIRLRLRMVDEMMREFVGFVSKSSSTGMKVEPPGHATSGS